MKDVTLAFILAGIGLLHLLPAIGVFSSDRLQRMYGVSIDSPDLAILLRHRAALFGIVGVLLLIGAFNPAWRLMALTVGTVSVMSFLIIAELSPKRGDGIQRVVIIDYVAWMMLVLGWVLTVF